MVGILETDCRSVKLSIVATQAERRASTRGRIVQAARDLFVSRGYSGTSISDVLTAAGVSRGALYHHFDSKEDVFAAVFVATSSDAVRAASGGVASTASPLDALVHACLTWLRVSTEPGVARILFEDGPTALGWQRCRTLEEATSLGVMRRALLTAVDSGEIEATSVDIAARLINAVLAEAALEICSSPTQRVRRDSAALVRAMIEGLAVGRLGADSDA